MTPTRTDLVIGPDLVVGPAQVWGSVRLVPLLRPEPITDLRLHAALRPDNELNVVLVAPRVNYIAFVPHSFVASWTTDGTPAAAFGTQLAPSTEQMRPECVGLRFEPKMARRTEPGRLRFLPLHMAMDGYLALHFGGPTLAWEEWSAQALRHGLSPRVEASYSGAAVPGLRDALRIFEILPDQCGMLLYVADALASAFVVGHPDDYRALHPTLVLDMYGELIWQYGSMYHEVQEFRVRLDDAGITSLADLRAAAVRAGEDWRSFHPVMSQGLFGVTPSTVDTVYRMSDYTLSRFLPPFDPDRENHIGEMITDRDGRLAYLKTFRLSAAQAKRGHLLAGLAANDWHVDRTAAALGTTRTDLISRIERAGFGFMLRRDVLDGVRAARRRQNRINSNS